jgi:hypothetical protein
MQPIFNQSLAASPRKTITGDASVTSTPTPALKAQHKSIPPELLKKPLLNLTGPPPESDSDDTLDPIATSPKKKRKRRRKKKNITGSGDPQHSSAVMIQ